VDTLSLYRTVRIAFCYLTHLGVTDGRTEWPSTTAPSVDARALKCGVEHYWTPVKYEKYGTPFTRYTSMVYETLMYK